jgi:argininosuccinate lyase
LDPVATAGELGFSSSAENSIDAVSDRDFAAEFLFCAAMIGIHLSRLGEEVVLWTTREFRWVELDDAYATGSSIMPQKKNPDVAELARGKSGRLVGNLTGLLTMLKGLPLAYDRDLQEDKEPVFDSLDTLLVLLPAVTGMIATMRIDADRLATSAPQGFALATDVAEDLVRRGVPFREAHETVGRLVAWCAAHSCELGDVDDTKLAEISPHLKPEVRAVLSVRGALAARSARGGTAPARVADQIADLRVRLAAHTEWAAASGDEPARIDLLSR